LVGPPVLVMSDKAILRTGSLRRICSFFQDLRPAELALRN
jgi:hypothetical protein